MDSRWEKSLKESITCLRIHPTDKMKTTQNKQTKHSNCYYTVCAVSSADIDQVYTILYMYCIYTGAVSTSMMCLKCFKNRLGQTNSISWISWNIFTSETEMVSSMKEEFIQNPVIFPV